MAFWKRSDDPWDRKPGQRPSETVWRETGHAEEKEVPLVEKSVENVENSPKTGEICPWCGEMMLSGHIYGGRDGTLWREGARQRLLDSLFAQQSPRQLNVRGDKPSWYCEKCEKLVISASGLEIPVAEQRTSFHEYVDQWNESEARRKKGD